MPTYSADVLPTQTGIKLGSASLQWDAFIQNLTLSGTFVKGAATITFPGSTDTLVGRATTDTLTNKTIDTAGPNTLKVNGTSLTAVTGTGSVVLATSPTLVTPVLGVASGTSLALAGNLTGATLNGTGSGNAVNLLSAQAVTGTLTGNSGDQIVYTYTIPANTIQAGKGFRYTFFASHTGGTAAITWKVTLGGTNLLSQAWSAAALNVQIRGEVYNVSGQATQTSTAFALDGAAGAIIANTFVSVSENLANAAGLKITFNVANTDTVVGRFFLIELIQ